MEEYKGYIIDTEAYKLDGVTVQYMGDDLFFPTVEQAKQFIDQIAE